MKTASISAMIALATLLPMARADGPEKAASAPHVVDDVKTDGLELKTDVSTLPAMIEHLSDLTNANIILIVPPNVDATKISIPAMRLRNVSLEQVLKLIADLPGAYMSYEINGDGGSSIYSITVDSLVEDHSAAGGHSAVAGLAGIETRKVARGFPAFYPSNDPILSVLPLERALLGSNPQERIPDEAQRAKVLADRTAQALTLIDQAFTMSGNGEKAPEIKLHAETHTLLVKATPQQVQTISQVLEALEVPGPSEDARASAQMRTAMNDRMESLMRERDSQSAKLRDELKAQMAETTAMRAALEAERAKLQAEVEQLRAELTALKPQQQPKPQ